MGFCAAKVTYLLVVSFELVMAGRDVPFATTATPIRIVCDTALGFAAKKHYL